MVDPTQSQIEIAPGRTLSNEVVQFRFVRSGGPGGQHVNKAATAAVLSVSLEDLAAVLPTDAMARLPQQAGRYMQDGWVVIRSEAHRSQAANRKACLLKLRHVVVAALHRPKTRRPTRPSRGAVERRLHAKRLRGQRKTDRGDRPGEE